MAVLSYWRNLLLGCGSVIVSNCCFLSVSYIAKHQPVSPGETDFTKQTFELQGLLSMDGPRSRNVKISSDFLISKKMLWKIRPHWTGEIMTSRSVVQIIIFGSSFMFKVSMYLKWFNFQKLKTFLSNIFCLEWDHYYIQHYMTLSLWQSFAVLKVGIFGLPLNLNETGVYWCFSEH